MKIRESHHLAESPYPSSKLKVEGEKEQSDLVFSTKGGKVPTLGKEEGNDRYRFANFKGLRACNQKGNFIVTAKRRKGNCPTEKGIIPPKR